MITLVFTASAQAGEAEDVFASVRDSIISVTTLDERGEVEGEGSGVVISGDRVVTNCHVVQEAYTIRVRAGNSDIPATLASEDAARDLCQLKVPGLKAPAVEVRAYRSIEVGEPVYAVGNPLGFSLSVSAGIVTAVGGRQGEPQILASAPISPGSSGGGLFDAMGHLIGITTRVLVTGQNFNVSLPADWIADLPRRGVSAKQPRIAPGPEPAWWDQAEILRNSQEWTKLADWAHQWREAWPTSADAGAFLGLALYNLNQLPEAKEALLAAIEHDARHALAHGYLALVRHRLGEQELAIKNLQRAMELYPSSGFFWTIRAEWYRDSGALDDAITAAQSALRLDPGNEVGWYVIGDVRQRQMRFAEAAAAYRTVLRLKPNDPGTTGNLAYVLAALGQTGAARQILAAKSGGQPSDAAAWVNLGVAEDKLGHLAEAETAYRKALQLDSSLPEAWLNLALSLKRTNRNQEAEEAIQQAVKHKPSFAQAWFNLGDLLNRRNNKNGAINAYEKAVAADPASPETWYALAELRREVGDFSGAITAFEALTQRDPANSVGWAFLGDTLIKSGRQNEAFGALKKAEQLDAKNEIMLQSLSMYYGMRGEFSESLAYGERALEVNPASPHAWSNKGFTLLKLQRYPEAIQALETAVRLQPDFANPRINLGEAYLRSNQLGKAIGVLEQALQLAPRATDARLYIAQAYAASGQPLRAKEYLESLLQQQPDFPPAWYLLTFIHLSLNERKEALTTYDKLKRLNPALARDLRAKNRARHPATDMEPP